MKKFMLTIICAGLFIATSSAFSDVPDSHWAKTQIDEMSALNIVKGYTDDTFRPENDLTRAEFLALLVRGLEFDYDEASEDEVWWKPYYDAARQNIRFMYLNEEDNQMNQKISRYEMAQLAAYVGSDVLYTGEPEILKDVASEEKEFVANAVAKNILTGYPDGKFHGDKSLTRAQAMAVISRLREWNKIDGDSIVRSGEWIIHETNENDIVTYKKTNLNTGENKISYTTKTVKPAPDYIKNEIGANGVYFWGYAGLFSYDSDGNIVQITDRPVIDYSYNAQQKEYLIITHPKEEDVVERSFYLYSASGIYHPFGTQILKIKADKSEELLLSMESMPQKYISMVTIQIDNGRILFKGIYREGQNSHVFFEYELKQGKIIVLSVPFLSTIESEQSRLNELGF